MKKNISLLTVIIVAILLMSLQSADAQKNWKFEFRPAVNFPMENLGNAKLNTGFGFEGTIAYEFIPHLAAFAGWSWNKFSAEQSFMGNNVDFDETGYSFGLQFIHPIQNSKISYLLRGGGTYNHIETENNSGDIINDTGHGLGWQAGGGITIPVGKRWLLIPELRYRSLSRNIVNGNVRTPVDLNYLSAGLGICFTF